MLISPAFAQAAAPAAPGGVMESLGAFLPLVFIFVIFYFLLIRPQQKRMKEHKAMLEAVRRGDRIVTNGGIVGTVVKVVNDTELSVEIADNVRVRVLRDMIANVLSKTEPVGGGDQGKGGKARKDTANDTDDTDDTDGDAESSGSETTPATGEGGSSGKLKGLLSGKKS